MDLGLACEAPQNPTQEVFGKGCTAEPTNDLQEQDKMLSLKGRDWKKKINPAKIMFPGFTVFLKLIRLRET